MISRQTMSIGLLTLAAVAGTPAVAAEGDLPKLEEAARRLQHATVTVRVWNPLPDDQVRVDPDFGGRAAERGESVPGRVTVCSGVAVGRRRVVTPIYAASDSQIRVTAMGGSQTAAHLRVLDEYSGLALIEADQSDFTPVPLADGAPKAGSWILSAAAWGTEEPVVSLGIVGAVRRTLPGAAYPPLLQCDLRTAETSSGAGVVDRRGRLIGVVVAVDPARGGRGWTYAVPVRHVKRLVRAADESQRADSVIILKRRRPIVGMVLDGKSDQIVVSHVYPNSPAAKAGIRVGDRILAADGVKIRSVYQAVRLTLYKQPGDKMEFVVQREGDERTVEVVLGGGVELPSAPLANLGQFIRPKLDVEPLGEGRYAARSGRATVHEVFAPAAGADDGAFEKQGMTAAEKIQLLEKALDRYRQAIAYLQDRLRREQQQREQTESLTRSLESQLRELKARLSQE